MPAFVCNKCGHYANTALSNYWKVMNHPEDALCHRCLIESGKASPLLKQLWQNRPRFDKAPDDAPRGIIIG